MAKEKLDKEAKEKAKFEQDRAKWKKEEAKRRNKKSPKVKVNASSKWLKAAGIALAVLLVLGIVAGIGSQMGLPQAFLPVAKVGANSLNAPEWAYYYRNAYAEMAENTQQWLSYYKQMGVEVPAGAFIDLSISPFGQDYVDETEETVKLEEYLRKRTNENITVLLTLLQEAKKNGYKLSDEDKASVDKAMEELKVNAGNNGMGASAFLGLTYTKGISTGRYRKILENYYIAQGYAELKKGELRALYPADTLRAEFDEDPTAYLNVSLRLYANFKKPTDLTPGEGETDEEFERSQAEATAAMKADAEKFLAAVTDEASFLALALEREDLSVTPNYNPDTATSQYRKKKADFEGYKLGEATPVADWAFDPARQAGDKALIETDSYFFVVYMADTAYEMTTVDYYSLPISFPVPEEEDGEVTVEQKAETMAAAENIVKQWQEGGGSYEAFTAIVQSGHSAEDGHDHAEGELPTGFTEQAAPGDGGEAAVVNWLFSSSRVARESAIIETSAGYTVVVFAGKHAKEDGSPDLIWMNELSQSHVDEDYEAYLEDAKTKYEFSEKSAGRKFAMKSAQEMCDQIVRNIAAQSSYDESMYS